MFDPHFKYLQAMENYVEHEDYIHFAFKWYKHGSPSFIDNFWSVKPYYQTCATIARFGDFIEKVSSILGVGTSMEESLCAIVIGELFLFKTFYVTLVTCDDPLINLVTNS
jgi:hypothetical protein